MKEFGRKNSVLEKGKGCCAGNTTALLGGYTNKIRLNPWGRI